MRIAVWHNLKGGGAKRALYEQAKRLAAWGHAIETWCPETADTEFLPLSHFGKRRVLPLARVSSHTAYFPGTRSASETYNAIESMRAHCAACAAEINAAQFDVVLVASCYQTAAAPLGHYLKTPSLLFLMEPRRALYEADPLWPWSAPKRTASHAKGLRHAKRLIENAMNVHALRVQAREERANAAAHAAIATCSSFAREAIMRAYGLDARVIPCGVDTHFFRPGPTAEVEPYVLGLGHFHPVKRVDLAITALAALPKSCRPILKWMGNLAGDNYLAMCQRLAADSGVGFEPIRAAGDAMVLRHLQKARLLLFTSRLEPLGLAPLEAGACGRPVVAIAEGGPRETILHEQTGLLVGNADPHLLGEAVKALWLDPARANAYGHAARQHVETHWQWEPHVRQLEALLSDIVQSRPGG